MVDSNPTPCCCESIMLTHSTNTPCLSPYCSWHILQRQKDIYVLIDGSNDNKEEKVIYLNIKILARKVYVPSGLEINIKV